MRERLLNQRNLTRRLHLLSVLCAMLLMPFSAWAQTTYQGGEYSSTNNSWGDWTVTGTNVEFSSSSGSLMCRFIPANSTSTIQLSLTKSQNTSEKLCALTYSPGNSSYSLVSAKIMSSDGQTEITDFTAQVKSNGSFRSFTATTPIEWGEEEMLVLTCQYENTSNTAVEKSISGATVTTGTPYDLVVGGITVTNVNQDCVTGSTSWDDNSKTNVSNVSFTPEDGKLKLFEAELSGPIQLAGNMTSLNIDINGESSITTANAVAISSENAANITFTSSSSGSLKLKRTEGTGLVGSNITLSYGAGVAADIVAPTSATTLADATEADIITTYGITVAGVPVTSKNAEGITGNGITGTVTYNAEDHALTLNGATIAGNIVVTSGTALTIKVKGENTINAGEYSALKSETATNAVNLYFVKEGTGDCSLQLNSTGVTVISTGFNEPTYTNLALVVDGVDFPEYYTLYGLAYYAGNNTYEPITSATITSYTTYDLFISGEQVTNLNMNAICKGTVGVGHITFDGEHTLTLNKVPSMVFNGSYPFIQTSMDLTINLVGNSDFDCGTSTFIASGDNNTHIVTFTTDATNPGMLSLTVGDEFVGFTKAFENGLEWMPEGYYNPQGSYVPAAWVAQPFALDGEGTAESPYLIKTANDLRTFSNYVNYGFITNEIVKLNDDINCSTLTGFVPIGSRTPFIGTFEGNGKTISGLTYNAESADDVVGLFARVGTESGPEGTIQNLVLENCSIGGGSINGGIVGIMNSGTLQLCKVTGNSTISAAVGANNVAGAIVGQYSQGAALVGNYYYYTVTTSTQVSSAEEAYVISGYQERGIGNSDDITADDGAMLYTKQLTATGLGDNCSYEGDPGYDPWDDNENYIFHYAPGANVTLYLYPNQGLIPSVNLSYTETGETEPTVVPLEKDPNEDGYVYSFTMPDVNATFAITLTTAYALYIGDTQVTDANADDVLGDGKVSFTVNGGQEAAPTYTLTLNGATIAGQVKVGLANLTVDVQGTNSITVPEGNVFKLMNDETELTSNVTCNITLKTSTADGKLTLTSTSEEIIERGGLFYYHSYNNYKAQFNITIDKSSLALIQPTNSYYLTDGSADYHTARFEPSYGVQIGETQIYEGNAADVFGDGTVSFDKEKSILTLNGASKGALCSSLKTLTVELVGDNTLTEGSYPVLRSLSGDNVTINLQSSAEVKGTLTMNMAYTEAGKFCEDQVTLNIIEPLLIISGSLTGNQSNDNTVVIGVNYGITINTATAGIVITGQNRKNVLQDDEATVQFDGRNTLILNGADIAGIVIGATTPLNTTDGLTVHLTGNNTITNGTYAITNEGSSKPLTLTTSDVDQGKLVYKCTTCTLTVANSAFSGFAPIKYKDNLAASLEKQTSQDVVTIVAVMEPFVTSSGETNEQKGDSGDGLGEDIKEAITGLSDVAATTLLGDGVIINKILYTLPGEADGYMVEDGKMAVALNTPMDDDDDYDDDDIYNVNKILKDIMNGTIQPGTELGAPHTFAERFHGMSFLLPAGYGEIELDVNTNEAGILHVKVGSHAPVAITDTKDATTGTTGFETIKIPYSLTEESYVFIYRYAPSTPLSRGDDGHRAPGRKETTTTGIRGLSVNANSVESSPEPPVSPKLLDKSLLKQVGNHITIEVEDAVDVEGIESDAFADLTGDITYIDLSNTAIKDILVDRKHSGSPFKDIPEKTFIYLPAGNTIAPSAPGHENKNVVIGSVCDDMELEMDESGAPFEAAKDFVAVKATQKRDYSPMLNKSCTVYLPFAINKETAANLGTFYELAGIATDQVTFESVEETKANTPYLFKPKTSTLSAEMAEVKKDIPVPAVIGGKATFEGTYSKKNICSDTETQYYCFLGESAGANAGKFVHVETQNVTVNPFRGYIKVTGTSLGRSLEINTGDDDVTAIKNIKVGTEDNVYYDLQGRRVLYPKKGIYIVNGKKVILK